jgi:hypothetical protein
LQFDGPGLGVWDQTIIPIADPEWDIDLIKMDIAKKYAAKRKAEGLVNGVKKSVKKV